MIENLGAHRLPPALMQVVGPEAREEIVRRNRVKGRCGRETHNTNTRNQRAVLRGEREQMEYTMTIEEAIKAAGL